MGWIRTGITKSGYGIIVPAPEDGLELDCLKHEVIETETSEMPFGTWEYIPEVVESDTGCQQDNYTETGYVADGYLGESSNVSYVEAGYVEGDYFKENNNVGYSEEDNNIDYAEEGYAADGYFENISSIDYVETDYVEAGYVETGYIETGYIEAGYIETGYVENGYVENGSSEGYAVDGYVEEGYFLEGCASQGTSAVSYTIHRWSRWIHDPVDYPYVRDGYFDEDASIIPCSPYVNIVDEWDDTYIAYPFGNVVAALLSNDRLSHVLGSHIDRVQRHNIASKILNKEE